MKKRHRRLCGWLLEGEAGAARGRGKEKEAVVVDGTTRKATTEAAAGRTAIPSVDMGIMDVVVVEKVESRANPESYGFSFIEGGVGGGRLVG